MSEIKKGDRVKVEFEGIVTGIYENGIGVNVKDHDGTFYTLSRFATRVPDPLPTKRGAMIRYEGFETATGGSDIRLYDGVRWRTLDGVHVDTLTVVNNAAHFGFTLLFEGVDS